MSEPTDIRPTARARRRRPLRLLVRIMLGLVVLTVLLPIVLVPVYLTADPVSTLMLARWASGEPVVRDWRPLRAISPNLARAVVTAEDSRFCRHHGVDWEALGSVISDAGPNGPTRGASTITMQTVKNLFLWQGAGYLRKPIEIALALYADRVWPKRRTLELYLNIAEWGPDGIFGAEAAARRDFHRGAASLTPRQAALLAAALPNPIERDPARPRGEERAWAATVEARAHRGGADLSCLGLGEQRAAFGG
ncbi:MAG TPA: transglycosylase domain-containing protein [Hyphomicrobiales bacterium]|nr:transglycosylase domain-containing protein [Hyphomicrobiales bacterium]